MQCFTLAVLKPSLHIPAVSENIITKLISNRNLNMRK